MEYHKKVSRGHLQELSSGISGSLAGGQHQKFTLWTSKMTCDISKSSPGGHIQKVHLEDIAKSCLGTSKSPNGNISKWPGRGHPKSSLSRASLKMHFMKHSFLFKDIINNSSRVNRTIVDITSMPPGFFTKSAPGTSPRVHKSNSSRSSPGKRFQKFLGGTAPKVHMRYISTSSPGKIS